MQFDRMNIARCDRCKTEVREGQVGAQNEFWGVFIPAEMPPDDKDEYVTLPEFSSYALCWKCSRDILALIGE